MIRALIFDFDGVIVLSEPARFAALQRISARYDVTIADDLFSKIVGCTTVNFFKLYLPGVSQNLTDKIFAEFKAEYKDKIIDHVSPIIETLSFIQNYSGPVTLTVASGSDVQVLETMLKHLGIRNKFAHVFGKEHVSTHKPDPAVYLKTIHELGVSPDECIIIEDSVAGATAAVAAKVPVYVFLNGVNSPEQFKGMDIAGYVQTAADIQQLLM